MVSYLLEDTDADRVFRALADRTRRDIVRRTAVEPASVSALAASYDMSFAAVQKHVAVLERAGLVRKAAQGRERLVRGDRATLLRAMRLLDDMEAIWRGRADRIEALLDEEQEGG